MTNPSQADLPHNTSPQSPSLSTSDKYRALLRHMQQGFCIIEVLFDAHQQPLDYRFLEVNPLFEGLTGLVDATGKTMRQLQPAHEQHWFELYGQVVKTGQSVHIEQLAAHLAGGVWYEVFAFPFGPAQHQQVAILFSDITERKQRQQQQDFLLAFSDALQAAPDESSIKTQTVDRLAQFLGLDRCWISEVFEPLGFATLGPEQRSPNLSPMAGVFALADYPQTMQQLLTQPMRINDVANDPCFPDAEKKLLAEFDLRALLVVPLRQGPQPVIRTLAAATTTPRQWTDGELLLLEDVAERTWVAVERARVEAARQTSEHFVQGVIRSLPLVIYLFDLPERRNRYLSPQVMQLFGYSVEELQTGEGDLINTFLHPDDQPRLADYFARIRAHQPNAEDQAEVFQIEYRINHPQRGWVWVQSRDTVHARDAEGYPILLLGTAEDITERKATAEALQESERRLRLTIEAAELATWEWNLATNEVYWNEQHFRLFGMEPRPNPISPEEFMRHVHPGEQTRINELLAQTIAERGVYDTEFLAVREDGTQRWMSGYGRITEERDGLPIRMSGVMFDVTDRKSTEEALRQKEQQLAGLSHLTLLDQTESMAHMGSWEYHRHSDQFVWSAGMYRISGIEPDQSVQPEIYLDLTDEADQAQAQQLIAYLRQGQGIFQTQLRLRRAQTLKTVRIKAAVIGQGEQTRVVGVDLDITQQLADQQRIHETADSLQAVLDASPASIGLLKAVRDPADTGQVVDFQLAVGNDKLAQFFAEPLSALLGQPAERFSALLWGGDTVDRLRQVFISKEPFYDEKPLPAPHQDTWIAVSVTRQDDGVMLTGLDITAFKESQLQQQHWLSELDLSRQSVEALVQLRATLQHRSESLRAVSHDLKSNFGIVTGALSLMELTSSEAERRQIVEMVLRNVKQATGLLGELLDLTRLEAHEQPLRINQQPISEFFREWIQSLQPIADERHLTLEATGPDGVIVETDPLVLYRLVQNLLMNALKYTHQGRVLLSWDVEAEAGQWWLQIADTGPGLATELVERLNNNHQPVVVAGERSISAAGNHQSDLVSWASLRGEGIGLRIVREITTLLGGELLVVSKPDVGTTFTIRLPLSY